MTLTMTTACGRAKRLCETYHTFRVTQERQGKWVVVMHRMASMHWLRTDHERLRQARAAACFGAVFEPVRSACHSTHAFTSCLCVQVAEELS